MRFVTKEKIKIKKIDQDKAEKIVDKLLSSNGDSYIECDTLELDNIIKRLKELSIDIHTAGCFGNETQKAKCFDWMYDIDDLKCHIEYIKNNDATNIKPQWFSR